MPSRFHRPPYAFQIETDIRCPFPAYLRRELTRAAGAALLSLPPRVLKEKLRPAIPYTLNLSVVSRAAIHKLNRDYRDKDRPTDVLSFSRLEGPAMPVPDIGDVILCWEIAKSQTKEYQTTRPGEVRRLVVHGVLHLFGYDHETTASDARRMFRLQERILAELC